MDTSSPAACAREEGALDASDRMRRATCTAILTLAYQSLGVVYGDLSTSPLYVYRTTFSGKLSLHEDDDEVFGVFSFIFWTLTIIPLLKYVLIVLAADDNGEGGTFAVYSLLCRHARLSVLPNQQQIDENLSTYDTPWIVDTRQSRMLKEFFIKHPRSRHWLLTFVLLGTCMAIGDGVLTPAISDYVVAISCIILVGVFSLQHLECIMLLSCLLLLLHSGLFPSPALAYTTSSIGTQEYVTPSHPCICSDILNVRV